MTGSIPITIEGMGLLSKLLVGKGLAKHFVVKQSHTPLSIFGTTEEIDLSMNKLFGIVPSELGAMSNLRKCTYPCYVNVRDEFCLCSLSLTVSTVIVTLMIRTSRIVQQ